MDPPDFVESVCRNMQLFPKEDFLTGDELLFHFDPQVTSAVPLVLLFSSTVFPNPGCEDSDFAGGT